MIADGRRQISCNGWRWAVLTAGSLVTFLVHAGQELPPGFLPERYGTALLAAAGVLLLFVLFLWYRRRAAQKEFEAEDEPEPQPEPKAYLNDMHMITPLSSYEIGTRPVMLGRVGGPLEGELDYIVIPEVTIGRRHALIQYRDFSFWIVDQGSINGTFINDRMISGEQRLKHGDRIRLHKYEFEFVILELFGTGMTIVSVDSDDDGK